MLQDGMQRRGLSHVGLSLLLGCVAVLSPSARTVAAPPAGYYGGVDTSTPEAARRTLHVAIDDHRRYPYTANSTDTWDILELAEEDPAAPDNVLTLYLSASYPKAGGGNDLYNREHTWPSSYGFPDDRVGNYPYSDCHMLFIADSSYNTSRGNTPFRYCHPGCQEKPVLADGGGAGEYPGRSNWREGNNETGTWEVRLARRGDVARALLYADLRYEGGAHGVSGHAEPDLVLCDDEELIGASHTGNNEAVGYMGMLSDLLLWHHEDPVDDAEATRNDLVFEFQGNRNPFVDHPEWVSCVHEGWGCDAECGLPEHCDDDDACTLDDCLAGVCEHSPLACTDDDPCTIDACDPTSGCLRSPITCDDGDPCTDDICAAQAGGCTSRPTQCPSGESCRWGSCRPTACDLDGVCDVHEDCTTCPQDCASGVGHGPTCGNGVCEAGDGEDCLACPADCAGTTTAGQGQPFCCGDGDGKGALGCADRRCRAGGRRCTDLPLPEHGYCCGDGTCGGAEDHLLCASDCGECALDADCDDGDPCTADVCSLPARRCKAYDDGRCAPARCGDGVCAGGGEDCRSCPDDCSCVGKGCSRGCCGDGACAGESPASCPVDCRWPPSGGDIVRGKKEGVRQRVWQRRRATRRPRRRPPQPGDDDESGPRRPPPRPHTAPLGHTAAARATHGAAAHGSGHAHDGDPAAGGGGAIAASGPRC